MTMEPTRNVVNRTAPIAVVPYDPQWPRIFEAERLAIAREVGDEADDTQHIGSTSVPGLSAKPIIDLAIIVDRLLPASYYLPRLGSLGYTLGISDEEHRRLFFWKQVPYPINLHIVRRGSIAHLRHILLRDQLRAHPELVREYELLKQRNAEQFAWDIDSYTLAKTEFIEAVVSQAAHEAGIPYPPPE
jgi:GrpB-like predicted nucleotidyltransferase (UPF0157 family)